MWCIKTGVEREMAITLMSYCFKTMRAFAYHKAYLTSIMCYQMHVWVIKYWGDYFFLKIDPIALELAGGRLHNTTDAFIRIMNLNSICRA